MFDREGRALVPSVPPRVLAFIGLPYPSTEVCRPVLSHVRVGVEMHINESGTWTNTPRGRVARRHLISCPQGTFFRSTSRLAVVDLRRPIPAKDELPSRR